MDKANETRRMSFATLNVTLLRGAGQFDGLKNYYGGLVKEYSICLIDVSSCGLF